MAVPMMRTCCSLRLLLLLMMMKAPRRRDLERYLERLRGIPHQHEPGRKVGGGEGCATTASQQQHTQGEGMYVDVHAPLIYIRRFTINRCPLFPNRHMLCRLGCLAHAWWSVDSNSAARFEIASV